MQFKSLQQDKFLRVQSFERKSQGGDTEFVAESDNEYEEQNFESLNLFGVPLKEEQYVSEREKSAKNRFVEEIIDLISEVDDSAQLEGLTSVQEFSSTFVDGALMKNFDAENAVNSNDYQAL